MPPAAARPRPTCWDIPDCWQCGKPAMWQSRSVAPFVRPAPEALGRFCRGALRPDEILLISRAPRRSKAWPCRGTGDRAQRRAGARPRASRARSRTHPLTAASRLILASLAPSSARRFVESNLRGVCCASLDRASGHQVARFTRDCGGFLEGYRILTNTCSGERPSFARRCRNSVGAEPEPRNAKPPGRGACIAWPM